MAKKSEKKTESKKQQRIPGTERPNRDPELDAQAEKFRKARNKWQEQGQAMQKEKAKLVEMVKARKLESSYFYDDDEGDTEEVKPVRPDPEDIDVKVNKVKQAKAKADE